MSERDPVDVPSFQKTKASSPFGIMVFKSLAVLSFLLLIFFGIYWSFGRIAFEELSKSELYGQVMRGQADVRRMAALEWATKLQNADTSDDNERLRKYLPTEEETEVLAQELRSLEASSKPDPDLITGVLAVIGHSYSVRSQSALREFLLVPRGQEWSKAQVQAVIGLFRRQPEDLENLEVVDKLLQNSSDPSLRKAAAYALGFSGEGEPDETAVQQKQALLQTLLRDVAIDVRWNAAFSAIRLGIGLEEAHTLLAGLIEELHHDVVAKEYSQTRETEVSLKRDTYLEALKLVQKVEAEKPLFKNMWTQIKEIAHAHPDLKIRQAAKETLGVKMSEGSKIR